LFSSALALPLSDIPEGTLAKDDRAWDLWTAFCSQVCDAGINPWRLSYPTLDASEVKLEVRLHVAFVLYCYLAMKPRSSSDVAPKVSSAWQQGGGVRRIFERHAIEPVPPRLIRPALRGLLALHCNAYGFRSLLPRRKEPIDMHLLLQMLATKAGTKIGALTLDWSSPHFLSLGAAFCLAASTGCRAAEAMAPSASDYQDGPSEKRYRRDNISWRINGRIYADPTAQQLLEMVPTRDGCVIIPPPSKSDPFGLFFSSHPIHLLWEPNDPANACDWLLRIELLFPLHGRSRSEHALFFRDSILTPMTQSTLDTYLEHFLLLYLSAEETKKRSFHSFRIGLACCLRASGCPDPIIQALCRWRSPESISIYGRLNADSRATYLKAAFTTRASSVSSANLPTIDIDDALAALAGATREPVGHDDFFGDDDFGTN
jgi:integrase